MLLPRLWIKIKIQISSLYSFYSPSAAKSAYFHFSIAFLFIVVLHSHLELFTGHIIDSRCLFHVNFTSYQCQSIIRGWVLSAPNCPILILAPRVHPRPPLGIPQTPVKPHYSPIPSFKSQFLKIRTCTFYSGKIIVDTGEAGMRQNISQ